MWYVTLLRRLALWFNHLPGWLFLYPAEGQSDRHLELDGIRGWAALSVLICHIRYTALYDYPSTSLFFHTFAQADTSVNVFFVLSGDALSSGVTRGDKLSPLTVLKRIYRLSGTVTIGLSVMYILAHLGLCCERGPDTIAQFNRDFACEPPGTSLLSYWSVLRSAWVGIYAGGILDSFLWTMSVELKGSVLVFAICSVIPRMRHRVPLLLALTVYVTKYFHDRMGFFVCGILFGQLRGSGFFAQLHRSRIARVLSGLSVLAIPLVTKYPEYFQWLNRTNVFDLVKYNPFNFGMVIVFLLFSSKDAVAFMRNPISQFLGYISFCLYVTHHHVMSSLFYWLASGVSELTPFAKDWISLVTWITAIALAYVCSLLETRYLRILDRAAKFFLKPPLPSYSKSLV